MRGVTKRTWFSVAVLAAAAAWCALSMGGSSAEEKTASPQPVRSAVDAGKLDFVKVPAEQSGLTQAVRIRKEGEPPETGLAYSWLSPPVDINGDGHADLIYYGHHGGGAAIWLGKGDGTFTFDGPDYLARWAFGGRDPVWLNLNGDGFLDGIGVEGGAFAGYVFINDGTGHWKKQDIGRLPAGVGNGFTFVDVDGDGFHDEVFQVFGQFLAIEPKPSRWGRQLPPKFECKPAFKAEEVVAWPEGEKRGGRGYDSPRFHSAFSVDLDGDDRNELIVHFIVGIGFEKDGPGRMHSWVLARDGNAQGAAGWKDVTAERGLPTGAGHWFFPEDLNGDGALDLIDLGAGKWHVNDGKGRFTESPVCIFDPARRAGGAVWDGDGEACLLDLDNDGNRDLVAGWDHNTRNGVFMNLGGGRFEEMKGVPGDRTQRRFADVNGDGTLDMVEITDAHKSVGLRRNDTPNLGLTIRLMPKDSGLRYLGSKVWVYRPGKLGDASALIHYRQCFMERNCGRSNVLDGRLHVGLGQADAADIRVRFPSGVVKDVKGAKAKTTVRVEE